MEKYLGGFPVNSIRVCVDEQEKDEIQGTICGVAVSYTHLDGVCKTADRSSSARCDPIPR